MLLVTIRRHGRSEVGIGSRSLRETTTSFDGAEVRRTSDRSSYTNSLEHRRLIVDLAMTLSLLTRYYLGLAELEATDYYTIYTDPHCF